MPWSGPRRLIEHRIEARPQKVRIVLELDRDTALWYGEFPRHWQEYLEVLNQELDQVLTELRSEEAPLEGTVHWFDEVKGYGFITAYNSEPVFVHWKGIRGDGFRSLQPGTRVRFRRRLGRLSVEAVDVECLDSADSTASLQRPGRGSTDAEGKAARLPREE